MINAATENQTPMENTSLPAQPQMSSEAPMRREVKRKIPAQALFGGILVVFLVVALAAGTYLTLFTDFDLRQQAWKGENKVDEKTAQVISSDTNFEKFIKRESDLTVGNVTVSTEYLEEYFGNFHARTPENLENMAYWREAGEALVRRVAIQNYATEVGFLPNTPQEYDPMKVNEAVAYFESLGTNHISGEGITLWFYNTTEPPMGVEKARAIQKERMDSYRQKIVSGQMTIKEAAEEIKANTDIKLIDTAWVSNTYSLFEYIDPGDPIFKDEKIDQIIWSMEPGDISEVLVGQDYNAETGYYDAYFTLIQVTDKETDKDSDNVEEVIEKVEQIN